MKVSKDELTVEEWVDEINQGLKYRQLYGNEKSWAEIEALFYNNHQSNMNAGPNILFSTGDALMSELTVPNPYLTLKSKQPGFATNARLIERVDNTLIADMRMVEEVAGGVLSAYLWGVGILKIGFDSEYGWDPKHDMGGAKKPMGLTLTSHDPKTGRLIEYSDIKPGMPWVKNVLPHDLVIPWGTRTLEESPWIAHRVVRHIDAIKADAKYDTKNVKDLQPTMSMQDYVKSYQTVQKPYRMGTAHDTVKEGQQNENDASYVELWEIYDKGTGKIFVIATGYDLFLRNEINLLQLNGLPFVGFNFTPRSRNFWVSSDAFYLRQCQSELADITVQQTKLRRLTNLKFMYNEDMISEDELTKAISHDVGVGIKINAKGQPIDNAIKFLTAPPNYDLQNQAQGVRQNLKETVGFNSNTFGEYQSGRKTAREVEAVSQGSGQRMSRRTTVIRDVYVNAFRKINPILENFWQAPRLMEVVGQDGMQQWLQFSGQHLQGEYEYSCGFSDIQPETLDARRNQAIQIYSTMRQDPLVNPIMLAQYVAGAFNDVDFSSIFQPGVLAATAQSLQAGGPPGQEGSGGGNLASGQPQQAGQGVSAQPNAQRQQASQQGSGSSRMAGGGSRN